MRETERLVDTFRVGLLLTERCNIACDHCWFDSGPDKTATMTLQEAQGYIDQARGVPTVEWISFTGGEPFLLPEALLDLVGYSSERGLRTECVTNCFWAETEERAAAILGGLLDAGLDVINISSDDFHQRHIPFNRVRNCYRAARTLGLKTVLMCASSRSSVLRIGRIAEMLGGEGIHILGDGEPKNPVSALAAETGFVPVGRAASIPREEWLVGESLVEGPCRTVLRDVGIAPGGQVLPCCSAASLVEDVTLGNAGKKRLAGLIEEAGRRPVFEVLTTIGPAGLAERLGILVEGSYVSRCHLCYEVLTDAGLSNALNSIT
jgi:hypothetical protein